MSLTPREAFKFGFLSRCVESGLSLNEAQQLVKQADTILSGPIGLLTEAIKGTGHGIIDTAKTVSPMAAAGLAAAPPIAGGLAGYGLAKATDINERDVHEVQGDELEDEYKRQTDLLRRTKAIRDAQLSRKRPGHFRL